MNIIIKHHSEQMEIIEEQRKTLKQTLKNENIIELDKAIIHEFTTSSKKQPRSDGQNDQQWLEIFYKEKYIFVAKNETINTNNEIYSNISSPSSNQNNLKITNDLQKQIKNNEVYQNTQYLSFSTQNRPTVNNNTLNHAPKTQPKILHPENNLITNLSSRNLSKSEKNLLNKGLSFVPTPTKLSTINQIDQSFNNFANRIATIFYLSTIDKTRKNTPHRKTNWIAPTPKNENILKYLNATKSEILKQIDKIRTQKLTQNLNDGEKQALETLKNDNTIIIKKADKGNSIVIMDRNSYEQKIYQHLNDNISYRKIQNNSEYTEKLSDIKDFLETANAHQYIDNHTHKHLSPPRIP